MPKEENLTGDQVVALTKNIYHLRMLLLCKRLWSMQLIAIVVNSVSLVSLISFTRFKWQESLLS